MFSGRGFFQHLTVDEEIMFIRNEIIKDHRRILHQQHPNQKFQKAKNTSRIPYMGATEKINK